ncbi:class I glutamine amidotransferase-like protein [Testicularia cyperi]|uniref:Class I glutamine amidotransferase-like protein n=1 Tax=Testicularia cyperi TaxID=1882483 RepID=A0A317XW03_9BASI|nr:class I glutamine amidotransferase-like protein [Testicularia cyperi]
MRVTRLKSSLLAAAALLALATFDCVEAKKKILIYSYTQGFRHYSIPTAVQTVRSLGENNSPGYDSVHSEDPSDFEEEGFLDQFDALVFISVSGKALSKKGAGALRRYIEAGGGYVGVHEACDALYEQKWYGRLVGAYFNYHPQITHATLNVVNHSHPSVAHLGDTWKVYEEMYNFNSDPSKYGKQYVLTADEDSYADPVETKAQRASEQGSPHPIAWWSEGGQLDYNPHVKVGGGTDPTKAQIRAGTEGNGGEGRMFYTGLGHTNAIWKDEDMQSHILGAIQWVLESPTLRSNNLGAPSTAVGSDYDIAEQASAAANSAASAASNTLSAVLSGTPVPYSKSQLSSAAPAASSLATALLATSLLSALTLLLA